MEHQTKQNIVKQYHKFLWDESVDVSKSKEAQIAKEYHDKLFKEYCIGDLSRYKSNQIALRWRTKKEVISGKGESICGNRMCNTIEDLKSWEVNFKYSENGKNMNALVKLRLCKECSVKLNYYYAKKHVEDKNERSNLSDSEKLCDLNINKESAGSLSNIEEQPQDKTLKAWESSRKIPDNIDEKFKIYLLDFFQI